jgi:predicted TIM-barrel fold metal-dependent hydrolase
LDADGIDVAVVSLQPGLGGHALPGDERAALENTWVAGVAELVEGSGGRLAALAPDRVLDGFVGTSTGASTLLNERHDPAARKVVAEVDAAGGLLFVHPEAEPAPPPVGRPDWWHWLVGYPGQMAAAYLAWLAGGRQRWPRIRVVFALLAGGAPFQHERLAHRGIDVRAALDDGVAFDTASYGRRAIELCIQTFGVERLTYGSDMPVIDPAPTLGAVRGFGDSVARYLMAENPARLLGRPAPEPATDAADESSAHKREGPR